MKSLTILSHKGGVGKTSVAVNFAAHLAKSGKNVLLLDCDFHGPSMYTFFEPNVKWINSYLFDNENESEYEDCLEDISPGLNLQGKMYVGFADPSSEAIDFVIRISNQDSLSMLKKLIRLKREVQDNPRYNIDYFIIDCNPGTGYSTVNSILVTDNSLFLVKMSNADIIGTAEMIGGLHKSLKNRSLVLANQVPGEAIQDELMKKEIQSLVEQVFTQRVGEKVVEFLGWIPTDYSLQTIEFNEALKRLKGEESQRKIFTLENPEHEFSKVLVNLIPSIFE
ncbi:MAG: ParA family protein [Candidatus Hodarchaeales archaeon]